MKTMSISLARNNLPEVVDDIVNSHEPLVITRYGTPQAIILPYTKPDAAENDYPLRGHPIVVADDFDLPIPQLWDALAVAEERQSYTADKRDEEG